MALDLWADDHNERFEEKGKYKAEVCDIKVGDKKVLLIKPTTFMNLSGESLAAIAQKHSHLRPKASADEFPQLIVLHDEVDLAFGKIRIKKGGGDAGHNGLKSIREHIGHGDFYRVRMGIGRPQDTRQELSSFVLQRFGPDEKDQAINLLHGSIKSCEELIKNGLQAAQMTANASEEAKI